MCVKLKIEPVAPCIRCHPDGRRETLETIEVVYSGCRIQIPDGFTFDGASVPRFFWRVVGAPTTGANLTASCVHDYLYQSKIFDRALADKIFLLALIELGKPKWAAYLMYYAVRVFGGKHY